MNQYKVKSLRKTFKGFIVLTYQDGELLEWKRSTLCKLNDEQRTFLMKYWPWKESELEGWRRLNLEVAPFEKTKKQLLANKVALFCSIYNEHNKKPYLTLKGEAFKLDKIEVTPELVRAYILSDEWWSKPKCIGGFVKSINALNAILAADGKVKKFPNEWTLEIQSRYSGQELQEYWAHLRELGMKPVFHQETKRVIRWD